MNFITEHVQNALDQVTPAEGEEVQVTSFCTCTPTSRDVAMFTHFAKALKGLQGRFIEEVFLDDSYDPVENMDRTTIFLRARLAPKTVSQ